MPTVLVSQLFTQQELDRAKRLYDACPKGYFAKMAKTSIIDPVIDRINERTGQRNDPLFLAYVLEHAMNQSEE